MLYLAPFKQNGDEGIRRERCSGRVRSLDGRFPAQVAGASGSTGPRRLGGSERVKPEQE
jgi:hypothetical protein